VILKKNIDFLEEKAQRHTVKKIYV